MKCMAQMEYQNNTTLQLSSSQFEARITTIKVSKPPDRAIRHNLWARDSSVESGASTRGSLTVSNLKWKKALPSTGMYDTEVRAVRRQTKAQERLDAQEQTFFNS